MDWYFAKMVLFGHLLNDKILFYEIMCYIEAHLPHHIQHPLGHLTEKEQKSFEDSILSFIESENFFWNYAFL